MPLAVTAKRHQQQRTEAPVPPLKKKPTNSYSGLHQSINNQQQQLCNETRAQYELLLQRQETSHERQLQTAQSKLQDVLSSHLSLAEHEKILFSEGDFHRRERADLVAAHARELQLIEAKWQKRERELTLRFEEEKRVVLDMLPPLELERNDALRLLKQQEIDQLTWSREIHEANHVRGLAEARLDEAYKHILTLKASIKSLELKPDKLQAEREKKTELYEKWQQAKLQLAELKGELNKQIAMLEKDLTHTQEALADEKECHAALQTEVPELRAQCRQLETTLAELRAKEQLTSESRNAERAQFEKELAAVQSALTSQRAKLQQVRQKADDLEQRVCTADVRKQVRCCLYVCELLNSRLTIAIHEPQELETKLEMLTRFSGEREAKWRHQKKELLLKTAQLKSLVRQLRLQQQEQQHDAQLSGLLFSAN